MNAAVIHQHKTFWIGHGVKSKFSHKKKEHISRSNVHTWKLLRKIFLSLKLTSSAAKKEFFFSLSLFSSSSMLTMLLNLCPKKKRIFSKRRKAKKKDYNTFKVMFSHFHIISLWHLLSFEIITLGHGYFSLLCYKCSRWNSS